MRQLLLTLILLLATAESSSQVSFGSTHSEKAINDWESFVIRGSSGTRTRMITQDSTKFLTLSVDFFPPECKQIVTFIYKIKSPLIEDEKGTYLLTLRVDQRQPRFGKVDYEAKVGDSVVILTLMDTPEFAQILTDMAVGYTLRSRIDEPNGRTLNSFTFSMLGFTASFQRAHSMCEQLAREPKYLAPKDYEDLRPSSPDSLPPHPNAPSGNSPRTQTPQLPSHPGANI